MRYLLGGSVCLATIACGGGDDTDVEAFPGNDINVEVCEVPSTEIRALDSEMVDLVGAGDRILWVQRAGSASPTELWAMKTDGTEAVQLRTSPAGQNIVSIALAGNQAVFLEQDVGGGPSVLWISELAENAAERVAVRTWDEEERLVGATATEAFVAFGDGDDVTIDVVTLENGLPATVGSIADTDEITHAVLDGDDLYLRARSSTNPPELYTFSTDDQDAEPGIVGEIGGFTGCAFPAGGFAVLPETLACGFNSLYTFARDTGAGATELIQSGNRNHLVLGAGGNNIYFADVSDSVEEVDLEVIQGNGQGRTLLACDMKKVANGFVDALVPQSSRYLFAVADDAVVWVDESRGTAQGNATFTLRAVAR